MNVLVDTSIWLLALRRRTSPNPIEVRVLSELIAEGRAVLIGSIRQELLCGLKTEEQYRLLMNKLRAFPDLSVSSIDHETAARFFNRCRSKGVQGSSTDFLICAIAARLKMSIFSSDQDFTAFAKHLPIQLHSIRP